MLKNAGVKMIAKCKDCGKVIQVYNTLNRRCKDCTIKNSTPIPKIGKKAREWADKRSEWVIEDKIDDTYWICEICGDRIYNSSAVEYHHIKTRGAYPELRLKRDNCLRLCQLCHYNIHNPDGKL